MPPSANHLTIVTRPPIHQKYLGEPDDPHYIPDSPWISRQFIPEEIEAELKRSCLMVLANVPHSDEMSDDPLQYLAAQILEGRAKSAQDKKSEKSERISASNHCRDKSSNFVAKQRLPSDAASSIQSRSSNRDTINTTTTADYSTPLTSAGLTPADSARRFSDAARKSYNSSKKPGSSLRNESQMVVAKSRVTSAPNQVLPKSLDGTNPSQDIQAIKRTLRLVTDDFSRPPSSGNTSTDHLPDPANLSMPDLNKSLPPPPPEPESAVEDQKQPHISRLMKTIKKKKSMNAVGVRNHIQIHEAPPRPHTHKSNTAPTWAQPPPEPQFLPAEPSSSKTRFRLRLFTRRHRPADLLVT
ncbi:hypothetical protein PV10_05419 [Exophiala mesophila]|uniref:Uncharacterized protein n=1 Tax=Exophiala mesophila TaxID=212818 RepID=A0A0D1Z7P5_EXOME|nr:uncharacterized protein PV10_05419 [Exophiala mesophila]KIV90812.1 hypothetical protein PV10_05419 [Exophiala mesophila]